MEVKGQRLLLKVEPLEKKTQGGLIIPESAVEGIEKLNLSREGVIEQLGDSDNFEVMVGEKILWNAKIGIKIDDTHVLIPQNAILYVR